MSREVEMGGIFSTRHINTCPGADTGPFCPPDGFTGGPAEYMQLIRERLNCDRTHGVKLASYARSFRRGFPCEITGPYDKVARAALKKITITLFPEQRAAG